MILCKRDKMTEIACLFQVFHVTEQDRERATACYLFEACLNKVRRKHVSGKHSKRLTNYLQMINAYLLKHAELMDCCLILI